MDASPLQTQSWPLLPRANHAALFARASAIALAGGLLALATLLFVRRISGVFDQALPGGLFVASIAGAVVWAAAIRLSSTAARDDSEREWAVRLVEWIPTFALPLFGVALAVPGTSVIAILVAAVLVAVEEYWAARFASRPTEAWRSNGGASSVVVRCEQPKMDTTDQRELWQEQRRFRSEHEEMISGLIRCRISPNDRLGIEHMAFCPPLAAVPHVELEPIDDSGCAARVTHVYRYGARIEVKRDRAVDHRTECLVAFEARSALGRSG